MRKFQIQCGHSIQLRQDTNKNDINAIQHLKLTLTLNANTLNSRCLFGEAVLTLELNQVESLIFDKFFVGDHDLFVEGDDEFEERGVVAGLGELGLSEVLVSV